MHTHAKKTSSHERYRKLGEHFRNILPRNGKILTFLRSLGIFHYNVTPPGLFTTSAITSSNCVPGLFSNVNQSPINVTQFVFSLVQQSDKREKKSFSRSTFSDVPDATVLHALRMYEHATLISQRSTTDFRSLDHIYIPF